MTETEETMRAVEVRVWEDRGFTRRTAAWVVYMTHQDLTPAWLVDQVRSAK